ncbi:hypothetical protein B0H14DRAFT_3482893 [Mycena olivaceomarginata]|nr:hypothetical protein B0H14DRAFT_3482893 [Mycena olivaceomarginata]
MPFSGNRRAVFNAMLLAQASFFYYFKRKSTTAERNRSDARISVLESVVLQLRSSDTPLSDAELARLKRLAAPRPLVVEPQLTYEPVPLKEILLGRGKQKRAMEMTDAYLDKIAEELEKSRQEQQ